MTDTTKRATKERRTTHDGGGEEQFTRKPSAGSIKRKTIFAAKAEARLMTKATSKRKKAPSKRKKAPSKAIRKKQSLAKAHRI